MTNAAPTTPRPHRWRFVRVGGVDQPVLDSAADLQALAALDPKLWGALACPTQGLTIDPRTLAWLDADGDGRIRRPEVLQAVSWLCARLRDPGLVWDGGDRLPLAALRDDDDEGRVLAAAARLVLQRVGRAGADAVAVADVADSARLFPPPYPNGDGVVPADLVADQPTLALWVQRLVQDYGGAADRSGQPGVTEATIDQADADVQALRAWLAARPSGDPGPWQRAWDAVQAVATKVDDHFVRCRLAAFDPRLVAALEPAVATVPESGWEAADWPLARVTPEATLPLEGTAVNPLWAEALATLQRDAVAPRLGARAVLSEADWRALRAGLQPWGDWLAQRPDVPAAAWEAAWLDDWQRDGVADQLRAAVARDRGFAAEAEGMEALSRLLYLRRDIATLLRNMVNFLDFYTHAQAAFQIGTLYIDQRECRLCLPVRDTAAHAQLAAYSGLYLLYGQCERAGETPQALVAALTAGDTSDFMVPGRHGVFVDRQGRDWQFTLQRVVENPISVREAFWRPYKRIARMIGDQIRKFAAARDQAVEARAAQQVSQGAAAVEQGKPTATAQAFDIAKFAGVFAAIGLALGAIGTALAALVAGLMQLAWWQVPLVVLGVMLLISGPSMLLAALKLRQRNIGPLLDANGWAVNARARVGIAFGTRLTSVAQRPSGSQRVSAAA